MLRQYLVFPSLFFVAFHVSYVLFAREVEPYSILIGFILSAISCSEQCTQNLIREPLLLIVTGFLAWCGNVLYEYALAFVTTLFVLVWVRSAAESGLVLYNTSGDIFYASRCILWACIYSSSVFVSNNILDLPFLRFLIPFGVTSIETVWMLLSKNIDRSYSLSFHGKIQYVALKCCVFLVLPLVIEKSKRSAPWINE